MGYYIKCQQHRFLLIRLEFWPYIQKCRNSSASGKCTSRSVEICLCICASLADYLEWVVKKLVKSDMLVTLGDWNN